MSKSRSGKTPNSNQNAPPATTQNVIIPGKFFESDWNDLLEIEDDENFISDIIDEITDAACNKLFDNIIKSRVQPHTVLAARELLLDIIEWNFLQNDPGESGTNEKLSWIEDDEPSECFIDNWAQGAVPRKDQVQHCDILENEEEVDMESLDTKNAGEDTYVDDVCLENLLIEDQEIIQNEDKIDENVDNQKEMDYSNCCSMNAPQEPTENNVNIIELQQPITDQHLKIKKKSKKYRPHVGSLPNFEKISLESVTDLRPKPGTRVSQKSTLSDFESSSEMLHSALLVRNQYGRASGPKEVIYNEKGNVVKVQKMNVANFPKHRVPVKYSILDMEKETNKKLHVNTMSLQNKKQSTEDILKRNSINAKTLLQKMHPCTTWGPSSIPDHSGNVSGCLRYTLEPRSPLPPLMVDSMNVADGVTIREGGLSKQVMKKATNATSVDKRSIYPIANSTNRVLEVKDIVSETSPSFRYIGTSEALAGM